MAKFHDLGDEAGTPHGKRARGGKADMDEERERDAKGGRVGFAKGGGVNSSLSDDGASDSRKSANVYNAAGSPTMSEATDETPGFTKGGRAKRKDGGLASGGMARGRMDHARRASGGAAKSPYSSGANLSKPVDDRPGRGYEGGNAA